MTVGRDKKLSIRTRLFLAMFAPSFLIVLLVGGVVLAYDVLRYRTAIQQDAFLTARILAQSVRSTLTMGDQGNADVILEALSANKDIRVAGLYTMDGKLYAKYRKSSEYKVPVAAPQPAQTSDWFSVVVPVQVGTERMGSFYLEVSLERYNRRIVYFALSVLTTAVTLSMIVAMLAGVLQRQFSEPVQVLAETARAFTRQRDFAMRAPELEIPEFNDLRVALNQMLEEIQQQNTALQKHTEDLAETNKQLTSANRELEAFTYSVSHDLRTPLRALSSYSQLALSEPGLESVPEVRDFLQRMQKNAAKMTQLIDDLLAFSRIDALELHRQKFSAEELVRSCWTEVTDGKTDRAELEVGELPPMNADRALMEQALINLLSNAVKYSRRASAPRVSVRAEAKDGTTVYRIADNGVGFDMRFYSKLFGVFQRLHTEQDFEGTGIGLAIVQRVIARHGGKVWATSEPGKGATFYFTLG